MFAIYFFNIKDAAWISISQSLKCTNPSEIFLLLKSSDFINHDISHAYENCCDYQEPSKNSNEDAGNENENENNETTSENNSIPIKKSITRPETFHLVLRKWYDLLPSMEFRCFVRNNELIAISQRDYVTYYDFLHEIKDELEDIILDFFEDHIQGTFDDPSCKYHYFY